MSTLSNNLVYLLKRFGTTQMQLSTYAGVSQNSISNWINEVSYPNAEALVAIHEYFGISIDALLLSDIEKSKIVTDNHVAEFNRAGKSKNVVGKVKAVSKAYFKDRDDSGMHVSEPDPGKLLTQLKQITDKIDELKVSVDTIRTNKP